jgi:ABC-type dipeptide/oligopeptide/nickel transport system permease component
VKYNQPREDLRLWLCALIAAAILAIALAMVMSYRQGDWEGSWLLPLRLYVLVVPRLEAGAVAALKGAVALRGVAPPRLKLLPALGVGTRWHPPEYTPNAIRYFYFSP